MTSLRIEFIIDLSALSISALVCYPGKRVAATVGIIHEPILAVLFPWRELCQINGIVWGSRPASGCYEQDFPKSNKHCSWHDGESQHALQQKKPTPFSPYQFLFHRSSLPSSIVQLFRALHLCLQLNSTLPVISLCEEVNKMQYNPNIFKSMNGNRIKDSVAFGWSTI